MARPKPDPEQVVPYIIECAIGLIKAKGFDQLTMKKLADSAGMSVGKLYRFFPGKDELFLQLEIQYFDGVYHCIASCRDQQDNTNTSALSGFREMLLAYYQYAIEHLELYRLVTSPPKVYAHYIDTRSEQLAQQELASALRAIAIFRSSFEQALSERQGDCEKQKVDELFLLFVNSVHGLILMSQSTAWPYIALGSSQAADRELFRTLPEHAPSVDITRQIDLILEKLI